MVHSVIFLFVVAIVVPPLAVAADAVAVANVFPFPAPVAVAAGVITATVVPSPAAVFATAVVANVDSLPAAVAAVALVVVVLAGAPVLYTYSFIMVSVSFFISPSLSTMKVSIIRRNVTRSVFHFSGRAALP